MGTLIISFREYLEVFIIIGLFLGISKKLNLKKEREIILAAAAGVIIAFLMPVGFFLLGNKLRPIFTEKNTEALEGWIMIFSSLFIAYVVVSLHRIFSHQHLAVIKRTQKKITQNVFDLPLVFFIVFSILREGLEIVVFTSSLSLISGLINNLIGLLFGFILSFFVGFLIYRAYLKISFEKMFQWTEFSIILFGGALLKNGVNELTEVFFDLDLTQLFPINLWFLPEKSTVAGDLIKNFTGLEKNFSLPMLALLIFFWLFVKILLSWTTTKKNFISLKSIETTN